MFGLFRSIRAKLLFTFFVFLLITTGFLITADTWFDNKERRIQRVLDDLSNINLNLQTIEKHSAIFFKDDIINEDFHKDSTSQNLKEREKYFKEIQSALGRLSKSSVIDAQRIDSLITNFNRYNDIFQELVSLALKRGFKDWGIEGKMRIEIHDIEDTDYNYDLAKMLMIRRHEKDFILRKQKSYIDKLQNAVAKLRLEVQDNQKLLSDINNYEKHFLDLTKIEDKMGFSNEQGKKGELFELSQKNNQQIAELNKDILERVAGIRSQNQLALTLLLLLGSGLVFVLAFFLARSLGSPISKLSASIHSIIENNFSQKVVFAKINSDDEVGMLSKDMAYMVSTVQNNIAEIQDQKAKVEKKQNLLMEGVSYAKRIQQAILPDFVISNYFKKYYVLYRPRYDVSGDFYWFTEINGKKYVAVVDCTGQGVSGAFMSLIGNTLLNQVIGEKRIEELPLILETLNVEFKTALHQNQRMGHDSMDICLCKIENHPEKEDYKRIEFSGANRSLYYSNGWEIQEIKGTERSIGGRVSKKDANFELHQVELKKGNFLYLTTDGYMSQNNAQQKKYGNGPFKELLRKVVHLPVQQQELRVNQELDEFMEGAPQKDDITLLALKL